MGSETSKALARRQRDARYRDVFMVGHAIDIGAGYDPLNPQHYPSLASVRTWDIGDGDAQDMASVPDASYNVVHSSHCLEHMSNPVIALRNWWRILASGGHLVLIVPDWEMYERRRWPSRFNHDHKCAFTCGDDSATHVPLYHLPTLLRDLGGVVVQCERVTEGFDPDLPVTVDQSTLGAPVCIDAVVYKP